MANLIQTPNGEVIDLNTVKLIGLIDKCTRQGKTHYFFFLFTELNEVNYCRFERIAQSENEEDINKLIIKIKKDRDKIIKLKLNNTLTVFK